MVKNTKTDYFNAQRVVLEGLVKTLKDAGETRAVGIVEAKLEEVNKNLFI